MIAIDQLIHQFHCNLLDGVQQPTRAACVNLIEGKLTDVVAFLNELTYGDGTTAEVKRTKSEWTDTLNSIPWWHPK